jgi:predicted nucleic acid-binding protein
MNIFFDSSAFSKRYIEEEGSDQVDELCQRADTLELSIICIPEVFSALNRRRREAVISDSDYSLIKTQFSTDIGDASLLDLTPAVITRAIALLENHSLRAMDALHVACALESQTDLFVSADQRQITAAQNEGLAVQQV